MAYSYTKITGNSAVSLITYEVKSKALSSIAMANIHASDGVLVDLYLDDSTSAVDYYIIKDVSIPYGSTLILEKEELEYDMERFSLYIQLSAADSAVDVIIR